MGNDRENNAKEVFQESHWQIPTILLKPGHRPLALDIRSSQSSVKHFTKSAILSVVILTRRRVKLRGGKKTPNIQSKFYIQTL